MNDEERALLSDIKYRLTQNKIWGGMGWVYHPCPSHVYLKLVERIDAAIKKSDSAFDDPAPSTLAPHP